MSKRSPLDKEVIDRLKSLLRYNPETGGFVWVRTGKAAGYKTKDGYINIKAIGRKYMAHRIAYVFMNGYCPDNIDHVNGDKNDNRIENLRAADFSQNVMNRKACKRNKTGIKGVNLHVRKRWFTCAIQQYGERIYLGIYDNVFDAACVVISARNKLHKDFSRSF